MLKDYAAKVVDAFKEEDADNEDADAWVSLLALFCASWNFLNSVVKYVLHYRIATVISQWQLSSMLLDTDHGQYHHVSSTQTLQVVGCSYSRIETLFATAISQWDFWGFWRHIGTLENFGDSSYKSFFHSRHHLHKACKHLMMDWPRSDSNKHPCMHNRFP